MTGSLIAHALCIFVTYWSILQLLVIFAYVSDEGHQSDRNLLLCKKLFNPCQRYNYM